MGNQACISGLKASPLRSLTINGYLCRIWYKGQPLVCNLCGVQGHKSSACPNKDKCHRCGENGHFACACTRVFLDSPEDDTRVPDIRAEASNTGATPPSSSSYVSLCNVDPVEGGNSGFSSVDPPGDQRSRFDELFHVGLKHKISTPFFRLQPYHRESTSSRRRAFY